MISNRTTSPSGDGPGAAWHPIGREIVFAAKEIREAFESTMTRAGGSLGTWIVLSALSRGGPVSQKMLADHVHVEGATMTHHIDRLEKLGLVTRRVSPGDRRVRHIEPTEAGTALYEKLLQEAAAFDRALFAGVSEADKADLQRVLAQITSNLVLLTED